MLKLTLAFTIVAIMAQMAMLALLAMAIGIINIVTLRSIFTNLLYSPLFLSFSLIIYPLYLLFFYTNPIC